MTDLTLARIKRAFDRRGCTGLTIWVNADGHIQANLRGPDNMSWGCVTNQDLEKALLGALEEFLNHHTEVIERKAKTSRQLEAEKKAFQEERATQLTRRRRRGR